MILKNQVMSLLRRYDLLSFKTATGLGKNSYTSGIKIAVKAKWFGQVRLLPTGMKFCFLVYLSKYNHVSW